MLQSRCRYRGVAMIWVVIAQGGSAEIAEPYVNQMLARTRADMLANLDYEVVFVKNPDGTIERFK